jgi:hypothetical protein
VHQFHRNTLIALKEMLGAAGLAHPARTRAGARHPPRLGHRGALAGGLHHWARPGELLAGVPDHPVFKVFWDVARADSFEAPSTTLSLRGTKFR